MIDGYQVAVGYYPKHLVVHIPKVVAEYERRVHHAPQREVADVLRCAEIAVAYFQHVGIVPAAFYRIPIQVDILIIDSLNPYPPRSDIHCGAPHVARACAPFPRLIDAPFAYGEDNGLELATLLLGDGLGCMLKHFAHISILQHCAVGSACYGIGECNGVDAFLKRDYLLEARGHLPRELRRYFDMVFFAVHVY